jgi:death-on-curing protein
MIDVHTALAIHSNIVMESGGANGIRDLGLLESALARPFQSFDGIDLYPSPIHKAAAMLESIVRNHPFLDGNKRTGFVLMNVILIDLGCNFQATEDEKYDFVISIAEGRLTFEDMVAWLGGHV